MSNKISFHLIKQIICSSLQSTRFRTKIPTKNPFKRQNCERTRERKWDLEGKENQQQLNDSLVIASSWQSARWAVGDNNCKARLGDCTS